MSLGEWDLRVLHPGLTESLAGNDRSLVLIAEARGRTFLLTGDLEGAGERLLLTRDILPEACCDVLKVGHHGSSSSTSVPFLARVAPRLALISAGAGNRYGHPSATVTRRLRKRSVRILRTDRDGQVRIGIRGDGTLRITLPTAPKGD